MDEYEFSDYGIFNSAVSTTSSLSKSVEDSSSIILECKTTLDNGSIFMGPICDSCVEAFGNIDGRISSLTSNLSSIEKYLIETSNTYQSGDEEAANTLLRMDSGVIGESTVSNSVSLTGATTQDQIYNYLSSQGFNNAAICGILANIQHESSFNPQALGDHGTSYGICQWHNSRWTNLKNYCSSNNLDSTTLEGQLSYLVYELKNNYSGVYNTLMSVPNTEQGAYDAAYKWTIDFEIPDDKYNRGASRGNSARETYWSSYGNK